jgi:hypothetical protein
MYWHLTSLFCAESVIFRIKPKNKITHKFQKWFRHQKNMLIPNKVVQRIIDRGLFLKTPFKNIFFAIFGGKLLKKPCNFWSFWDLSLTPGPS